MLSAPIPTHADPAPESDGSQKRVAQRWLLGFAVLGFVLRVAVVAMRPEQLAVDTDAYLAIGRNLSSGLGYCSVPNHPTAFRPPLYPFMVAALISLSGSVELGVQLLGVAQSLLGAATVWLTGRLAERLNLGARVACVASLLVAIDPLLLNYTSQAMTEVTMTFLTTGYLASLCDQRASALRSVASGIWFGLCVLCRPTLWAYAVLAGAFAVGLRLRRAKRQEVETVMQPMTWRNLALALLAVASLQTHWVWRNADQFGQAILTTTHGGYTLALGNNAHYFRDVIERQGSGNGVWTDPELAAWQTESERLMQDEGISPTDEGARDIALRRQAIRWITENPISAMHAAIHRVRLLWAIAPQSVMSRTVVWSVGVFYVAVFLCAIWGVVAARAKAVCMQHLLLMVVSVTALHTAYWANARMRAPLTPIVAIYAAIGATQIQSKVFSSKRLTV